MTELLEACRQYGKLMLFVHISSDEVYGAFLVLAFLKILGLFFILRRMLLRLTWRFLVLCKESCQINLK